MEPPLWSESGVSRYPWEREALEFLRANLPNHEPFRAWSNVEFVAEDGSVNEVDLLVVVPGGMFLVEIKSYPDGVLSGDSQIWRWRRPDGRISTYDHPLIATDRKAKRLKSLLSRQRALKSVRVPFIEPLVFLSGAELSVQLDGPARSGVTVREAGKLPGVLEALKDPAKAGYRATTINRPLSKALADAIAQAGIRPTTGHLRLNDWTLGEVLDEGAGWQDFAAFRTSPKADRRVRIYLANRATDEGLVAQLNAAARNEFKLLERLKHPNVAQVYDLQQHEFGPALVMDRNPLEQRLDLWAPDNLPSFDLLDRLALVRQIGDALSYAHRHRVTHRSLTPRHVLVRPPSSPRSTLPQFVVGHWNLGTAEESTRLTMHATRTTGAAISIGLEMAERMEEQDRVYLAPELAAVERENPVAMDVFSLGAIAALVLTGRAPAADLAAREAAFAAHRGLMVSDALPQGMVDAILFATDPEPNGRFGTVEEFLHELDRALDDETSPSTEIDPLDAKPGDVLEGGWTCVHRLGGGATAIALLCRRGPLHEVLKIARNEDHAQRLRDEADALGRLWASKPAPVGVVGYRGIDRIGGHTTLHLDPAGDVDRVGDMTLGNRLRHRGRPGLDILARWGDDLLETLSLLERAGVAHRDIKPDNLGVTERGRNREPHLVLFDFSLAKTPATDINAGTPGYLDPFLSERPTRRWDTAADRYSAGVTLFEMATGSRPIWGDGTADPRHLSDLLPNVEASQFDPSVADGLARFFERALHRDPTVRFGTAEEMRAAWHLALSATSTPTEHPPSNAGWDPLLPIQQLGLSPAAVDLLEAIGVHKAGQLVEVSSPDVSQVRTVSNAVRQEILSAAAVQRRRRDAEGPETDVALHVRSVDAIFAKLVPSESASRKEQRLPIARLLGVEPPDPGSGDAAPSAWFGPIEARLLGLADPSSVRALLGDSAKRWSKALPMKQVRDELATLLRRNEGIASGDELARGLIARRGTTAAGTVRLVRARAVVRAALETASADEGLRWRRLPNGGVIVALVDDFASDHDGADALSDHAAALGRCADELALLDPLLSPQRALALLRDVPRPAGMRELGDARLLRLATDASTGAALSSRNELYPRGMAADRAIALARTALHVPGRLSEEQIRERVQARFPDAERLPAIAELTELLRANGLEWAEGDPGGFHVAAATSLSQSTAFVSLNTRLRTTLTTDDASKRRDAVQAKLERSIREGGYLVCSVEPSRFLAAETALTNLGASLVDLDAALLDALHLVASERNVSWSAILAADAAGPSGARWGNLIRVAKMASERVEAQVLGGAPVVVLSRCGLLDRFDALGLLDRLREATTRERRAGQTLRTAWVLVPTIDLTAAPTIFDRAVPTTPGTTERVTLDTVWFDPHRQHTEPSPLPSIGTS